jgi:hypothetical protein
MGKIPVLLKNLRSWGFIHRKEIVFGMIIFLVASISFALGYLANDEVSRAPIIIQKQ